MSGASSHLGTFLRECRQGLKYTSRQVAKLSAGRVDIPSISNSYLISVENGKHIPRLDKIIALADLLNVPVTQLVDRCRRDLGTELPPPEVLDYRALFDAGREHAEMSDHAKALQCFRQAYQVLAMSNGSASKHDLGELRLQIANCYRRLKINRVAKEELENFLKDKSLDVVQRARGAFALSDIYREEGSTFLGTTIAREALRLAQTAGDESLEGRILSSLGNLAAEEDRHEEALALYRDASIKLKSVGHERAARLARAKQGLILVEMRDFFKAIDLLRGELAECRDYDPYVRGWLHIGLAKAYHGAENYKSARINARSAKECADKLEAIDLQFLALFYLWLVARIERSDDLVNAYFEKLKLLRNKLDIELLEVQQFDRLRKAAQSMGASR